MRFLEGGKTLVRHKTYFSQSILDDCIAAKDLRDQIFDGQVLTGKDFTQCGKEMTAKNVKI